MIHGQVLTVGVSGYLLGIGVNPMGTTARYGFGADHVWEYTMVLPDGSIAKVNNHNTTVYKASHDCKSHNHDFLYQEVEEPQNEYSNEIPYQRRIAQQQGRYC